MRVKVHEQEKKFYLAAGGWMPMVGNEITIGKHSFCATPYRSNDNISDARIIFSEVTSGSRLTEIKLHPLDVMILDEKKDYLNFIKMEAKILSEKLSERKDLDEDILRMRNIATEEFGPKPPTEEFYVNEEVANE